MKIHDKFVIELREVIKGYGNDPTSQDLCKFPCDYKFYEISGVAICEESFKKMKRLEDEINDVLDKIRAEIEQITSRYSISRERGGMGQVEWSDNLIKESEVLKIIDKYRREQE